VIQDHLGLFGVLALGSLPKFDELLGVESAVGLSSKRLEAQDKSISSRFGMSRANVPAAGSARIGFPSLWRRILI
jgi:hypothetical protein